MRIIYAFLFENIPVSFGKGQILCSTDSETQIDDDSHGSVFAETLQEAQKKISDLLEITFEGLPYRVERLELSMPLYDGPLAQKNPSFKDQVIAGSSLA